MPPLNDIGSWTSAAKAGPNGTFSLNLFGGGSFGVVAAGDGCAIGDVAYGDAANGDAGDTWGCCLWGSLGTASP